MIYLKSFPMPPSSNNAYATCADGRRHKSKEARAFGKDVEAWHWSNAQVVRRQLTGLQEDMVLKGIKLYVFNVDAIFWMRRSSIICKDGTPKRNDTSNRIKLLHDALAGVLGIDDSMFWSGTFDKIAIDAANPREWVDVTIRAREMCL